MPATGDCQGKERWLAAGLSETFCNHTFRGTGITVFLQNRGSLEAAQDMANHSDPRTTKLYDRRKDLAGGHVRLEQVVQPGRTGPFLEVSSGERLLVDAVLVAAGRNSNIDALRLDAAGITPAARGATPVDEHFRTVVPHIYAAGDVIGFLALASTSMDQGRHVIRHAFGPESPGRASSLLPTGVYTIPEVSMIGETEESLRHANVDYVVGRGS